MKTVLRIFFVLAMTAAAMLPAQAQGPSTGIAGEGPDGYLDADLIRPVSDQDPGVPAASRLELPGDWSWTYYRPTNTGIQGDWSGALWIDPEGAPYIAAYNPFWEEGGLARFIEAENRWENFSNVDYPEIGDPDITGSARIETISTAEDGSLWMVTWNSVLHFDPDGGAAPFRRYDEFNSPLPGGRAGDIGIAPDGTVWSAWQSTSGGGGLVRHDPATDDWTVWDAVSTANDWPGWAHITHAAIQPKPGGGYYVRLKDTFYGLAVFDSDTQLFSLLPSSGTPGEIGGLLHNSVDEAGNAWMFREQSGSGWSLDYRRPDGSWVTPPAVYPAYYGLTAFQAFGDTQALMVAAGAEVWHFDGLNWSSLGDWPSLSSIVGGLGMDADGNVWVSGSGGAARLDAGTGQWQRHRITNSSQIDMWVRDISFGENGDVWVTGNAGPGYGGFGVFDGLRWYNFNDYTYGLGGDWGFNTDNTDAITYRPSTGAVALNPMFNGIHEWDGSAYKMLEPGSQIDGLTEDSLGRLWIMGNYFSLRYHDGTGFTDVPILGWGANVVPDPDRPGTVWACANGEVVRTDGEYLFSRTTSDLPELNPLHDVFTTVAVDRNGVAWVGSTEGLFRLDAETGTHQWWHSSNSALPGDQVTPLAVTPDGRVWFTNFNSFGIEASLVWFDGNEFGTITRDEGLPHAQIYDGEARAVPGGYELWISCASRGIAVLNVPFSNTVAAGYSCTPDSGTVPFATTMTVRLDNLSPDSNRRMAARLDAALAGGMTVTGWRNGFTNISPSSSFQTSWNQAIPAVGGVIGNNVFTLVAEDVTPPPFNQPPYPPAGDTDSAACTVTGVSP